MVFHRPVRCDKCEKRTITMTRLLCLGCLDARTSNVIRTTDYCSFCLFEELHLDCAVATKLQTSWHSFLQIRRFTFNKWIHVSVEDVQRIATQKIAEHNKNPVLVRCYHCAKLIESLPMWYCLECNGKRYRIFRL